MGRADVTISEKYRRIVEAYQIEMDYGRTIEAYEGEARRRRRRAHRAVPARRPRRAAVPDARRQGDRLLGRGREEAGWSTTTTAHSFKEGIAVAQEDARARDADRAGAGAEGGEVVKRRLDPRCSRSRSCAALARARARRPPTSLDELLEQTRTTRAHRGEGERGARAGVPRATATSRRRCSPRRSAQRDAAEARSKALSAQFDANELKLAELEDAA